jgi:hypothetical protein
MRKFIKIAAGNHEVLLSMILFVRQVNAKWAQNSGNQPKAGVFGPASNPTDKNYNTRMSKTPFSTRVRTVVTNAFDVNLVHVF